jgi:hypothetical protein
MSSSQANAFDELAHACLKLGEAGNPDDEEFWLAVALESMRLAAAVRNSRSGVWQRRFAIGR